MEWTRVLERLGFTGDTFCEALLTTMCRGVVNTAPMGFKLVGDRLWLRVYKGSVTHMFLSTGCCREVTVCITSDPVLFYNSLFRRDRLVYNRSRVVATPYPRGCNWVIECSVENVTDYGECIVVELKPLVVYCRRHMDRVYSRVGPAIIEALVYYTKLKTIGCRDKALADKLLERIKWCRDIVYSASDSRRLHRIINSIYRSSLEVYKLCHGG